MVVIKINEVPDNKESLKNRVSKNWRINSIRLENQSEVVAVHKGEIIEVHKILSYRPAIEHKGRVAFELEEIKSVLKGKKIDYKTANPCTITEQLNFK